MKKCTYLNYTLGFKMRMTLLTSHKYLFFEKIHTTPTSNAEEAEVDWFYEDLQDLIELIPKKRCPFHHRGLECKNRKWLSEDAL